MGAARHGRRRCRLPTTTTGSMTTRRITTAFGPGNVRAFPGLLERGECDNVPAGADSHRRPRPVSDDQRYDVDPESEDHGARCEPRAGARRRRERDVERSRRRIARKHHRSRRDMHVLRREPQQVDNERDILRDRREKARLLLSQFGQPRSGWRQQRHVGHAANNEADDHPEPEDRSKRRRPSTEWHAGARPPQRVRTHLHEAARVHHMGQALDAKDGLPRSLELHMPSSSPREVVLPGALSRNQGTPRKHLAAAQGHCQVAAPLRFQRGSDVD